MNNDKIKFPSSSLEKINMSFITEAAQNKNEKLFKIENASPPTDFNISYTPLPIQDYIKRINSNVLCSLKVYSKDHEVSEYYKDEKYQKWSSFLQQEEHIGIISDGFWYAWCHFFNSKKFLQVEENLLSRLARNYVNLLATYENDRNIHEMFKKYFDITSQSVFYAFVLTFPQSRYRLNDDIKVKFLEEFAFLFTGVKISNPMKYIKNWYLDLGVGNILRVEEHNKRPELLPEIKAFKTSNIRSKRTSCQMRYSPLVSIYLERYKYKTQNYLKGFKIRMTETEKNDKKLNEKFADYLYTSTYITRRAEVIKQMIENEKKARNEEIESIKRETVHQHRRLEKKKHDELEKGAHEYANYLVSMLNSGITVAMMGVGNAKV